MSKVIIELEDTPDGRVEFVVKCSRPLPDDYRDMTKAETVAGRMISLTKRPEFNTD